LAKKNTLFSLFISFTLAIACCLFLAFLIGENPLTVFVTLVRGAFGSATDIGYTLFYATPLIFTGLSVAVAFHGGLFNIGAEGQLYMGALALGAFGMLFPHFPLAPFFGILVAMIGGALWGSIAGLLKAYRGSHEVIVTIMLNFIAYAICGFFILHVLKNPLSPNPETAVIGKGFFLPGLGSLSQTSPVNFGFAVALITALAVWFLLFKTTWGFKVRLAGANPATAARSGIRIQRRIFQAMALSGGLAGLVAVNEIMGFAHKFRDQFSSGYGFMGIAVALLGRNRPLGIVIAAILFGALQKGSLDLEFETEKITRDLASVMEALIILFVASQGLWSKWRKKHDVA
jgi:simple sugar transport system permease protein